MAENSLRSIEVSALARLMWLGSLSLIELNLRSTKLCHVGATALADVFSKHGCPLVTLNLSSNALAPESTARLFSSIFKGCRNIENLDMSMNECGIEVANAIHDSYSKPFAEKSFQRLKRLEMDGDGAPGHPAKLKPLGNEGVAAMAKIVRNQPSLAFVSINGQMIRDFGAEALTHALTYAYSSSENRDDRGAIELSLRGNFIGRSGISAFEELQAASSVKTADKITLHLSSTK